MAFSQTETCFSFFFFSFFLRIIMPSLLLISFKDHSIIINPSLCWCKFIYIYMCVCLCVCMCVFVCEGGSKVQRVKQILDFSRTFHFWPDFTCTEITIEIWIVFSSFIKSDSVLPQPNNSATDLLFDWGLEPFQQSSCIYIYIYILSYTGRLFRCITIYIYIYISYLSIAVLFSSIEATLIEEQQ